MGELTCLDASQLAAIIFGAVIATLAVCAGCALTVWYLLLANRNSRFAKEVPGLEKFLSTGLQGMCRATKSRGDNLHSNLGENTGENLTKNDFSDKENKSTERQPEGQQLKRNSTTICNDETDIVRPEVAKQQACRVDSMEEISLNDTTPDDIRLIERVVSKLNQSEWSGTVHNATSKPPAAFSDLNNKNDDNDKSDRISPATQDTKHTVEAEDRLSEITLTTEQRVTLEANRKRLETERQQLRQLGIL